MRNCTPICDALLTFCLCAATTTLCAQTAPQITANELVSRIQAAQKVARDHPQYVALRQYRLAPAESHDPSSTVLAKVEYLPPSKKQFSIQESKGSDRGEKIVRKVLEHEAEMASHADAFEFTTNNYDFSSLGQNTVAGKRYYVVQLAPKRDCPELIRGQAWVDPVTFLITRVEGEPAKSPSWWIKNLHITIEFGRADGLWLPLETRATADLRLLGKQTLTSENVQVQAVEQDAKLRQAPVAPRPNKTPRSLTAAGVWIAR